MKTPNLLWFDCEELPNSYEMVLVFTAERRYNLAEIRQNGVWWSCTSNEVIKNVTHYQYLTSPDWYQHKQEITRMP